MRARRAVWIKAPGGVSFAEREARRAREHLDEERMYAELCQLTGVPYSGPRAFTAGHVVSIHEAGTLGQVGELAVPGSGQPWPRQSRDAEKEALRRRWEREDARADDDRLFAEWMARFH